MSGPRVQIITLGCKVNQCDADEMAHALTARGCHVTDRGDLADIYIVNTCTVTATADAKARKLIRRLARSHSEARIVVTGCLAQRDPVSVARLPGVCAVVPNTRKAEIADIPGKFASVGPGASSPAPGSRTRAFLKVQDGCDHRCAYCAVPDARGDPTSKPSSQVLGEVRRLATAGVQELVLCGIRLGAYGRQHDGGSLASLLRELRDIEIPRLRLSSIEPMDFDEELIEEITNHPRICHHLHIPLQSGDDAVLSSMGRGYTGSDFAHLVSRIRAAWPDAAVTTDVLVAFPGETEEQFQRTADFVREMSFSRLHVFPFSPRPGTAAVDRPHQVPAPIRRDRTQRMLSLAHGLARAAARAWVGRRVCVLFEEQQKNGRLTGLTEHYVRLYCRAPFELVGSIAEVVATEEINGALLAEPCSLHDQPRSAVRPAG